MAPNYVYTQLSDVGHQIRLLTLYPGQPMDMIKISLCETPLIVDDLPEYEALSYVWGSHDNLSEICVKYSSLPPALEQNGRGSDAALLVTQNLAVALKRLRHRADTRVLWIDAICINQEDYEERSEQVARMADIYRLAWRVVMWLGPESSDSDLAMDLVTDLGSKVEVDYITQSIKPLAIQADAHWVDVGQQLPYRGEHVSALEHLCGRTWFERLWIVQEVRLSNAHAIAICGSKHCTWKQLRDVLWCIARKGTVEPISIRARMRLLEVVDVFNTSFVFTLDGLVSRTRNFNCADPRDRIYAVLGITYDPCGIKPDYRLTPMEVYQDATRQFIQTQHKSDVIRGCELRSDRLPGPTWVPDWSKPKLSPLLRSMNAAGETSAEVVFCGGQILRVAGVRCATISGCTPLQLLGTGSEHVLAEVSRLLPADVLTADYKTGCTLLEAFCGTLACLDFAESDPPRPGDLKLEPTLNAMRALLCNFSTSETFDTDQLQLKGFVDSVVAASKERCLISTHEGYVGMAPSFAQCGDVVCVFLGCVSPIVLRPIDDGHFQLVGECFVYGLSNSVAILGSFPAPFRVLFAYSESLRGYRRVYRNLTTGATSEEDPRLHRLGISPERIHENRGSRLVTAEQLESAAVKIDYFDLV